MRYSPLRAAHRVPFLVTLAAAVVLIAACGEEPTSFNPSTSSPSRMPVLATAALGSWTEKAPMPTDRTGLAGAVVQNASGQYLFYTIGGSNSNNPAMRRVEAYNVATNAWTRRANLPTDRRSPSATTIGSKIYVVGGTDLTRTPTKTLYVYNQTSNTWSRKADLPAPSARGMSGVINGRLYHIVANSTGTFGASRLYRYNPSTDTWTRLADPISNHFGGFAGVIEGKLYAAWGVRPSTDVYDPVLNRWAPAGPGEVVTGTASAVLGKRLYAMGGHDDDDNIASETSAYDPVTKTWIEKASMQENRDGAVAGTVRNAAGLLRIIVAGGEESGNPKTEMYTP
jgi:N-acetylneuraminic acid mutarotase